MVDINKPFTMKDLEKFHAIVRELPKVPTRVRVGRGMYYEITKVAMQPTKLKDNREYRYVRQVRATPVILDEGLALYDYEVDYD